MARKKVCKICGNSGIVLDIDVGRITGKVCECVPTLLQDVAKPKPRKKKEEIIPIKVLPYNPLPESILVKIENWANSLSMGRGRDPKTFTANYRKEYCKEYHDKLFEYLPQIIPNVEEIASIEACKISAIALAIPKKEIRTPSLFESENSESDVPTPNPRVKSLKEAIQRIEESNLPPIDSIKLTPALNLPSEAENWLMAGSHESILFWGPCGTGKTTYALTLAVRLILEGKKILCFDIARLISLLENSKKLRFGSDLDRVLHEIDNFKDRLKYSQIVLIDDIGATENQAVYDSISSLCEGKILIGTTNCWKESEMSLQGKTLEMQTGPRFSSRLLAAKCCYVGGEDRRQTKNRQIEIFPREVVDNFHLPRIRDGETTIMRWLQRNPVFQVLSTNERKSLTDENGIDFDVPARVRYDVWHKGDELTLHGPILDMNDQILFLALVELLHSQHNDGGRGLTISTTRSKILNAIGLSRCGDAYTILQRRLKRLARATVEFQNSKKKTFIGSFIVGATFEDNDSDDSSYIVTLNPYLMKFYYDKEYTQLSLHELRKMSDYEQVLYQFASSHERDVIFPLKTLERLAGKEDQTAENKRAIKKQANKGIARLKERNLLGPESHINAENLIHAQAASSKNGSDLN
jgi:DNA polymerase III delta prime subunit